MDQYSGSGQGYYERKNRGPSQRAIRHAMLTDLIRQIHLDSRRTYGSRRVHAELRLGRGIEVGHGAVELLMHRAGIVGASDRPKWKHSKPDSVAADHLERQFGRTQPNQLWVTDVTEQPGTVIHSDQGTVFGSWAFTQRAKNSGLVPSMGSVGACYDNSIIESFWSRMQVELLDTKRWKTRIELANAIFDYLEIWHDRRRPQSFITHQTPGNPKSVRNSALAGCKQP